MAMRYCSVSNKSLRGDNDRFERREITHALMIYFKRKPIDDVTMEENDYLTLARSIAENRQEQFLRFAFMQMLRKQA